MLLLVKSPVRGGKAIKTDRKVSNTLNQLLSRVKTIFSRKAHHEEKPVEPTTQQPSITHQRLKAALSEVEKYLADNFGTDPSTLAYKEYNNGISLTSDDPTFSTALVVLTQTKGMLNLPDNVIILGYVNTNKGDDYLIEHLGNFIIFLKRLGIKHRIQHLAIAFSKEHYDTPNVVQAADITCIRLY